MDIFLYRRPGRIPEAQIRQLLKHLDPMLRTAFDMADHESVCVLIKNAPADASHDIQILAFVEEDRFDLSKPLAFRENAMSSGLRTFFVECDRTLTFSFKAKPEPAATTKEISRAFH